MRILGLESSCDDTAAAVIHNKTILSEVMFNQDIHEEYGGVVPELASRDHIKKIIITIQKALDHAETSLESLDGIAVTYGPGLVGSLLIGVAVAKSIAWARDIPLIGVNHLEGHIFANYFSPDFSPPFIAFIISGGHTHIYSVHEPGKYELLGKTRDDAAGEAFDKAAKFIGLPYPGGPSIDQAATKGDHSFYQFPRAMLQSGDYDFSFSGLKTAFINYIRQQGDSFVKVNLNHILASFQEAIVDSLLEKLKIVVEDTGTQKIVFSGGVIANSRLRDKITALAAQYDWHILLPEKKHCTDNGFMIAACGDYLLRQGELSDYYLNAVPQLTLH